MSSHGRWRFNLLIIFLTFLPLNLDSQGTFLPSSSLCLSIRSVLCLDYDNSFLEELVQVFGSSQDHLLIQSGVYENRRNLAETPLPSKGPTVEASPPSPDFAALEEPSPPLPPPKANRTPSSPPSGEVAETPETPPAVTPQPLPPSPPPQGTKKKSSKVYMIVSIVVGVFIFSGALIISFLIFSRKIPIKPWTSSGQLQDALITDVPRLQLSELQAACEDFSNVIGSFSDGTIYKGTLPTGAEIAVVSITVGSRAAWSTAMETQLLQKMHKLSKVDHKNFLNVIGYCHQEEPFNRMLVFEYAPNGSLSENLHSQHMEHLDWPTRLRIVMGIAYCLEHMHNLSPPILHTNLDSSSVYLTEDNAAKLSDFSVINSIFPSKEGSSSKNLLESSLLDTETNVFNFGAVVFEIISGKFPDPDSLFIKPNPARDLVDPTLKTFQDDAVERLLEVVRQCMNSYSAHRPTMREVVVKLREITGIEADAAMPRLSPRWWTELEIIST